MAPTISSKLLASVKLLPTMSKLVSAAATIVAHPDKPLLYVTSNRGGDDGADGAVVTLCHTGVDIEIRRSMWDFLRQINEAGTTIILTTHYLEEAESLCRHVAIIDEGRIIENARMSEVLRKLQREVFVLSLSEPLQTAPKLEGFESHLKNELELEVALFAKDDLNSLFRCLDERGIRVTSLRNKANRLEELFIGLVEGKAAKDGSA